LSQRGRCQQQQQQRQDDERLRSRQLLLRSKVCAPVGKKVLGGTVVGRLSELKPQRLLIALEKAFDGTARI
jgi:hypothetical protein